MRPESPPYSRASSQNSRAKSENDFFTRTIYLKRHLSQIKILRVVTLLCGGNIDTTVLGRCLERGLAADGRLVKFTVTVSDRPGGIAELAKTLTQCGVSIKDMMHERAWIKSDIFAVSVSCKSSLLSPSMDFDSGLSSNSLACSRCRYHFGNVGLLFPESSLVRPGCFAALCKTNAIL